MTEKRILFCSALPGREFREIMKNKDFKTFIADEVKGKTLQEKAANIDPCAIISLLSDKIDKNLIDSAPSLEVISNYAVGFNNIDIEHCAKKGIYVTNTPGVLTDATADIAFMLMLMVSRRAVEADSFTRKSLFKGWAPELFAGKSLQNKTLGIAGMGRIGFAVAERAAAFGMKVIYFNRNKVDSVKENRVGARYVDFKEILAESDFLSLHLPYTSDVHHLIGEKELKAMKKEAVLINTARGPLIDEKALTRALKEKNIYGAGLDVYENEPLVEDGLKNLDNVVLLPHIGSATEETRSEMAKIVINDSVLVLRGKKPLNIVNGI